MSEYTTPFKEAWAAYAAMKDAEFNFRKVLSNLHLVCPACKKAATINRETQPNKYWISCTSCGLSTSTASDFNVVTAQWDAMCSMKLDPMSCAIAVKEAMKVASDICIYTNSNIITDVLEDN